MKHLALMCIIGSFLSLSLAEKSSKTTSEEITDEDMDENENNGDGGLNQNERQEETGIEKDSFDAADVDGDGQHNEQGSDQRSQTDDEEGSKKDKEQNYQMNDYQPNREEQAKQNKEAQDDKQNEQESDQRSQPDDEEGSKKDKEQNYQMNDYQQNREEQTNQNRDTQDDKHNEQGSDQRSQTDDEKGTEKDKEQHDQMNDNQQNREEQAKQNKEAQDDGTRQENSEGPANGNQNNKEEQAIKNGNAQDDKPRLENSKGPVDQNHQNREEQANQNRDMQDNGPRQTIQENSEGPANERQENRQEQANLNRDNRPNQIRQENEEGPDNRRNTENKDNTKTTTEGQDSNARKGIFSNIKNSLNRKDKTNTNSQDKSQSSLESNTKSKTPASSMLTGKKKVPSSKKKDFDKSFSSESILSYNGETFNTDGSLTDGFKSTLKPRTDQLLVDFDALYPDVIDYQGAFGDKAESLVLFIYKFTKKFDDNRNIFEKFFNTGDLLEPFEMKQIPLDFLAALKTEVLKEKMEMMNKATETSICNRLGKKETTHTDIRKILQHADCSTSMSRAESCKNPISEVLAQDFEETLKRTRKTPTEQDCKSAVDGRFFCALSYKTIKRCPVVFLFKNLQRLGDDEGTLRSVFKLIFTSTQVRELISTEADITSMQGLLHYLKPAFLRAIDADLVMSTLQKFALEAGKMDSATKTAIRKIIRDKRNLGDLRGTELLNALPFLCIKRTLRQLNSDAIAALLVDNQIQSLDLENQCVSFFAGLEKTTQINTKEKFVNKKRLLEEKSAKDLREMDLDYNQLLREGELKDFKPKNREARRAILDNVLQENNLRDFNKDDFKNMGSLIADFDIDEVEELSKEEFTDGLVEAFRETPEIAADIEGPSAEKISGIMMDRGSFTLEDYGDLFGEIAAKRLMNQDENMYEDLSGETERNITCEKQQCPILYKAFRDEFGQPGLENTNYTQTAFQNLDNLMTGMPISEMKDLPPTRDICVLMEKDMTEKQQSILVNKVKYFFGLMDSDGNEAVTVEDIQQCKEALKFFSVEDLNQFSTEITQFALQTIGQTNLTDVSMENIEDFTSLHLDLMGKKSGRLDTDNMEELGYLACGLEDERFADIVADAVPDKTMLDSCPPFTQSKCKKFVKAIKRKYNRGDLDSIDQDILLEIGECIVELDEKELDQISDDIFEDNEEEIMRNVKKSERKRKKLSKDKRSEKKKRERKVKESVVGAKTRNKQRTNNRRRRSTTVSLTCDEMKLIGSGVTALTTAQIVAMADNDFLECANILGQYSDWSTNQITALTDVATRTGVFNIPSLWTANNVESSGIISQGLTPNELSTLTDLTAEAMYSIGRHDGWSAAQLEAGFARWLNLKGGMPSGISSTDLVSLGHFACGATTNHIDQLNATEYSFAASHIGTLTSCQEHQLEAYVNLAKSINAFGNVSTWSTSVISAVGSVIGGLNAAEIGSLSTDQVAVIEPETIALIPSSAFVGFTVDQLSSFSLSQSTAVTQNQQAGLSPEQLQALAEAGATLYSTAQCLTIPAILTFIPITLAYIFHL